MRPFLELVEDVGLLEESVASIRGEVPFDTYTSLRVEEAREILERVRSRSLSADELATVETMVCRCENLVDAVRSSVLHYGHPLFEAVTAAIAACRPLTLVEA